MTLLQESLAAAARLGAAKPSDFRAVIVDTTVQEKAITFPTDAKLMHRARERLVKLAKRHGIALRQSYARVGKIALIKHQRYAHAKQMGWMPAFSDGIAMCQVRGAKATQRRGKHPWKKLPSLESIWQRTSSNCTGRQPMDLLCFARN